MALPTRNDWTVWVCPRCGLLYTHSAPCENPEHYNHPTPTEQIKVRRV